MLVMLVVEPVERTARRARRRDGRAGAACRRSFECCRACVRLVLMSQSTRPVHPALDQACFVLTRNIIPSLPERRPDAY